MQWLNGNISFFVRKCILDSFLTVLTEYDASKYALCTFFHFTMRYTGILRTLEILYMCARVFTFKTQQNNKKSFLLNDLHLRNRDKPLTILFLCYNFGFFIYLVKANCHVVVCELFLLFLLSRLSWSDEKGKIYMSIELYCNDLILLKTRIFQSKLISLYIRSRFIR